MFLAVSQDKEIKGQGCSHSRREIFSVDVREKVNIAEGRVLAEHTRQTKPDQGGGSGGKKGKPHPPRRPRKRPRERCSQND